MTAPDRREELEAAIWHAFRHLRRPAVNPPRCVDEILAAADRYRDAARGELATRMTTRQMTRLGAAEAEKYRRSAS